MQGYVTLGSSTCESASFPLLVLPFDVFCRHTGVGHNQEMDNIAYSLPRIGIGEASNASCSSNKWGSILC